MLEKKFVEQKKSELMGLLKILGPIIIILCIGFVWFFFMNRSIDDSRAHVDEIMGKANGLRAEGKPEEALALYISLDKEKFIQRNLGEAALLAYLKGRSYNDMAAATADETRKQNLLSAIAQYRAAAKAVDEERQPQLASTIHLRLGAAFHAMAAFETPMDYLKWSLDEYGKAEALIDKEKQPVEYAALANGMGKLLSARAKMDGELSSYLRATGKFNEALEIYTPDKYPLNYAETLIERGDTRAKLAEQEEKLKNRQKAGEDYATALSTIELKGLEELRFRAIYNSAQNLLAMSKIEEPEKYLDEAVALLEPFIEKLPADKTPGEYSDAQWLLGLCYSDLAKKRDADSLLIKAADAYSKAADALSPAAEPLKYGKLQGNTGVAYAYLYTIYHDMKYFDASRDAFNKALEVFDIDSRPLYFAGTHENLGDLYMMLGTEGGWENQSEKAAQHYLQAMRVHTATKNPRKYKELYDARNEALSIPLIGAGAE
ncbi:MAG TPA: hypothetical protein PLN69_07400 [bacterium]|nr:hypothetical protein [bacterium]